MHLEHKAKRENEQDATNSMFIIKPFISTCFGHHYAHHQENKTVSYSMRCSAWVCRLWLAVVLCSCVHTAHDAAPQDHSQPQPTHPGRTPHTVGHGLILLMMDIMMSETCWDRKFDNKHRIICILLVLSLHPIKWWFCFSSNLTIRLEWHLRCLSLDNVLIIRPNTNIDPAQKTIVLYLYVVFGGISRALLKIHFYSGSLHSAQSYS